MNEFVQAQIEVDQEDQIEKKPKKPDTSQLNVRLEAEVVEYAKAEAERLGVSQAELVATVIQDYKARHVAEIHPNFASDKDSFDSHQRAVADLYTSVIAKYNTLREDIEREVQDELDRRKAEIDILKNEAKDLKVRAEKAEAEAKETAALRETIAAKEATIADKDAIIAANANLATRLDEALAKADEADAAERELSAKLAETEKGLEVANSKIELLLMQADKAEKDAERRLNAARSDAEARIAQLKAEHEAALKKAEIEAAQRLEKAELDALKQMEKAEAACAGQVEGAKAEAERRIAKLEADLAAKDGKVQELFEKITELSKAQPKVEEE